MKYEFLKIENVFLLSINKVTKFCFYFLFEMNKINLVFLDFPVADYEIH